MTVAGEPLIAHVDGAKEATVIAQTDNTPPDVYAGEEQVVQLSYTDTIRLIGDAIDLENDPVTYQWVAVPANAESVSTGEDADGSPVDFRFGDSKRALFESQ